jgi:hypothetical protein
VPLPSKEVSETASKIQAKAELLGNENDEPAASQRKNLEADQKRGIT